MKDNYDFKNGEKNPYTKKLKRKVTIKHEIISRYFDPDTSDEDIEEIICGLLDEWKQRGGQRR